MNEARFSGKVISGRLPRPVSEAIAKTIARMEGKTLDLIIKERKRRRSANQNAYMWGCVIPPILEMFRDAGNNVDAEDVHSYLKEHVGKLKQVLVTSEGEVLTAIGSTAKLSTMEFDAYLEKIRAWGVGFGLQIPMPNEIIQSTN